ncbi:MAG: peptidoglycan-binding domain-containing protein [bacterium]
MKTISKIAAIALVAAFVVVGAAAPKAQAATVAELQAMIAQLTQQIAALSGTTAPAATTFTSNLTVGSTGAEVSALQNFLASKGFLTATARGYFGALTKAAVKAYQTSKGIAAVGNVGPQTRAALNADAAVAAPAGTTTTTTTTTGTVSTVGAEGTLSVTKGAISNSTLYEGDVKAPVLSLKVKAQSSDIKVDRIKLDLGSSTDIYNKDLKTVYVLDENNNVLASSALNSDTVVKDSGEYYITLTGINYVVAKGASKYITIAADVYSSVKAAPVNVTVALVDSAIRGTDGAGIDQYAGSAAISQTVSINTTLTDSADVKLSTDTATPATGSVIANSGSLNNEADKVTVLAFDVKAEKDNVQITDLTATTSITTTATLTNAYLYDGSTLIASGAVSSNKVTFNDINYNISKDSTKTLTLKVDVRNATADADQLTASVTASGISAQNSTGSNISVTGGATSNTLNVQKAGPVYTLVGTPALTKSAIGNTASSSYLASFNFNVSAKGTDVVVASSSAFAVGIFNGNSQVGSNLAATYEKPTSGITTNANGDYVIADGNTATFTASVSFTAPAGAYTVGQIVTARVVSATTSAGQATYISDSFRTNQQAI